MADTQTANQWKQTAANAQANLGPAQAELASRQAALDQANARYQELSDKALVSYWVNQNPNFDRNNPNSPGYADWQAARAAATQAYNETETAYTAVRQQQAAIVEIEREVRIANTEAARAEDSPPGTIENPTTSSNPPPANQDPGNNTDVVPPGEEDPAQYQEEIPPDDPSLGELGINTDLTAPGSVDPPAIPLDDPSLGELGINTTQITDATLGEAGINPDFPPPVPPDDPGLGGAVESDAFIADTVPPGEEVPDEQQNVSGGVVQARSSGNEGRFQPLADPYDYRVKIKLAKSIEYFYQAPGISEDKFDILRPLVKTDGVVFPYTPQIQMQYVANYAATDLVHSNYKIYNYTSSSVEQISIIADFTAQDVEEANYVLAVIHFFRSVTKMFYGQDQNRGVPPPLVYLYGHGELGFDRHAMVISNFSFTWPNDVDYINAGPLHNYAPELNPNDGIGPPMSPSQARLQSARLQPGGIAPPPKFGIPTNTIREVTRVPTKLQINLSAYPIVTRDNISNEFSLERYSTGQLLKGRSSPGGGMW